MNRHLAVTASAALFLSASAAYAADLPSSYGRPVYAPPPVACSGYGSRPSAHGWQAPQMAYIVAETCGPDQSLSAWLKKIHLTQRVPLRVYYNGGSMDRTDILTIEVPPQPQLR